jgi:hypothetical protein
MKQIYLITEDEPSNIAQISFLLGRSKINIDSISMNRILDKTIITLATKSYERALEILNINGFKCYSDETLIVKLKNDKEEISKLSNILENASISITQLTAISEDDQQALYLIKTDKPKKASKILQKNGYLLEEEKE